MPWLVKWSACKQNDLSSSSRTHVKKQTIECGMVCICNPSTGEAETGGFLVCCQAGLANLGSSGPMRDSEKWMVLKE